MKTVALLFLIWPYLALGATSRNYDRYVVQVKLDSLEGACDTSLAPQSTESRGLDRIRSLIEGSNFEILDHFQSSSRYIALIRPIGSPESVGATISELRSFVGVSVEGERKLPLPDDGDPPEIIPRGTSLN